MKVLVFGATGGTGRLVVEKALEAGHAVTGFARTPGDLEVSHDNLTVVSGDALDGDTVTSVVANHDAVVSTIGSDSLFESELRTNCMRNILPAVEAAGDPRLLVVSALGAGDSASQLSPGLKIIMATLLRRVMADHTAEEALIASSGVDATVIRPGRLTDKPERGDYRLDTGREIRGGEIPRADLASFIVDELASGEHAGATVAIV